MARVNNRGERAMASVNNRGGRAMARVHSRVERDCGGATDRDTFCSVSLLVDVAGESLHGLKVRRCVLRDLGLHGRVFLQSNHRTVHQHVLLFLFRFVRELRGVESKSERVCVESVGRAAHRTVRCCILGAPHQRVLRDCRSTARKFIPKQEEAGDFAQDNSLVCL